MTSRAVQLLSRTLIACSLVAGLAAPVDQAAAQQIAVARDVGFGGWGDGLAATVNKSDTELMAKLLKFSDDQKAATGILYDTYVAEHNKRAQPLREAQETARNAFREDRDFSVFSDLMPKQEAFAKESAAKEKELIENIKGLLTKEQTEQWPLWERAHRRANSMNRGMLAAERPDLIQIVERLAFPPATMSTVNPTLDAYALELDRALIARDETQKAAMEEGKVMRDATMKAGGPANMDMTEMMKKADELYKKSREASIPVRDINRKYAKQIEAALTGVNAADGERFAKEFRKAVFPDVYRERYVERAMAAALAIEGLDKGQKEAVTALKEQYARDKAPMEAAAEKAAEETENNFSLSGMMGGGMMKMMGGGDEATQAARKARRELDNGTLDKLKAILTPEQAEQLPDRSKETANDSPFGVFGGPGGGPGPRVRVTTTP
jgi:hypothetical protein